MDKVCVIVPIFNEEKYAISTIKSLMKIKCADKIIVVDDGSTDRTWEKICGISGIYIIRHSKNSGKAKSLLDGVKSFDSEIYLFADGDLGLCANRLELLIDEVMQNKCDLCIARMPETRRGGGIGLLRAFSRFAVKALTGVDIPCPLSGQRAVNKKMLNDKRVGYYNGYGVEIGMLIDALNSGYKVTVVDIELTHRITGRDMKGYWHRIRQFFDILNVVLYKFMGW
jgi:glycosyltransferase involved in cell wall biosynthesis